jgi:hypothetical protein
MSVKADKAQADPGYQQVGFILIGTIGSREGDQTVRGGVYTQWSLFGHDLDNRLERQPL